MKTQVRLPHAFLRRSRRRPSAVLSPIYIRSRGRCAAPFVVLCNQRSGSTHLIDLLGQQPDIWAYNEILHGHRPYRATVRGRRARDTEDGATFLDRLYCPRGVRQRHAIGFKLMYDHALEGPLASAWDYLAADTSITVIEIVRENLLESLVSQRLAERSNRWHLKDPSERKAEPKIVLSPYDCIEYFESFNRTRRAALERLGNRKIVRVTYQELCRDQEATLARICGALNLPPHPAKPLRFKIETLPMEERIQNYQRLRDSLMATAASALFTGMREIIDNATNFS